MSDQNETLRALSQKEEAASPGVLAAELRTSDANIRTYLSRLKKKGYVEGSGQQWYITDSGRDVLEKGDKIPTTTEDVGEDELSRFKYFGQLAGVDTNLITACVELFQNSDMRSMDEFDRVMAEQNIPQTHRNRWRSNYLGYLRNTTPQETRNELYPIKSPGNAVKSEEGSAEAEESFGEVGMDYVVEGNEIIRTYPGMGMFTFKQAIQVLMAKRGATPRTGEEMGIGSVLTAFTEALKNTRPDQSVTFQDLMDFAERIKGNGGEVQNPLTGYVDEEGWHEVPAGRPIFIERKNEASPQKNFVVIKQTPEGIVTEEHQAGQPIIIQSIPSSQGSSQVPMVLFPALGSDGQLLYDREGKPVYANLEPMMKYLGFQAEQKRADECHRMLVGLGETVRENFADGVQALKMAAQEFTSQKKEPGTAGQAGTEPKGIEFLLAPVPVWFWLGFGNPHQQYGVGFILEFILVPEPDLAVHGAHRAEAAVDCLGGEPFLTPLPALRVEECLNRLRLHRQFVWEGAQEKGQVFLVGFDRMRAKRAPAQDELLDCFFRPHDVTSTVSSARPSTDDGS